MSAATRFGLLPAALLAIGSALAGPLTGPLGADEVLLISGEVLVGEVAGERLELRDASGALSVPHLAIERLVIAAGAATMRAELVDGSVVEGEPRVGSLTITQGLIDRTIPLVEIGEVTWDPPLVLLPAGTPVPLARGPARGSPASCVAVPVRAEGVVVIDAQAPVLAAGGALVALAVDGSEVPLVTTADADDGRLGAPAVVTTTALVGADVGVAISVEGGADYQTLRAACASAPLATGGPGAASEGARRPPTPVGRGERPVAVGLAGVLRRLAASRQAEEVVVLAARPTDSLALSRVDLGLRRRLGGSARLTVALELRDLAARGGELTLELQVTADQAPLGAAATVRLPPAPDGEQRLEAVMSLTDSELAQLAASVEPELRIRVLPAG